MMFEHCSSVEISPIYLTYVTCITSLLPHFAGQNKNDEINGANPTGVLPGKEITKL